MWTHHIVSVEEELDRDTVFPIGKVHTLADVFHVVITMKNGKRKRFRFADETVEVEG